MYQAIKVSDLELSEPVPTFDGLEGYAFMQLLLRWHGRPFGYVQVPVSIDHCKATDIIDKIMTEQVDEIQKQLLYVALEDSFRGGSWNVRHLLTLSPPRPGAIQPTVSVAVCTRDRTEDLTLCLKALLQSTVAPLEILVIDNAPGTTASRELIGERFPDVRYILEPRPGLDWARNRAIQEARGEIIAYTDDDVIVDAGWVGSLGNLFAENDDVMAITGLVVPYELETEAQFLFEKYGGFGRGFVRKWYRVPEAGRVSIARQYAGTGQCGTGANMAFRHAIFSEIGLFDPAMDVGTVTHGGGDLDMFFRVLKHGHALVYEPSAIVRHRHRREYAKLYEQITNNGIGFYAYLVRNALAYPEERVGLARFGMLWLWELSVRRGLRSLLKPCAIPRDLILAEFRGSFTGLLRYQEARKRAKNLLCHDEPADLGMEAVMNRRPSVSPRHQPTIHFPGHRIAVRTVEVTHRIEALEDVTDYPVTRLLITQHGKAAGAIHIKNDYRAITAARLIDEMVQTVGLGLLYPINAGSSMSNWAESFAEIKLWITSSANTCLRKLPDHFSASIVIATLDRPEDLRACLRSLVQQITSRPLEIVVVDNHPQSGLTPPIVAEFPRVRLVSEPRGGRSYASNAGFCASVGDILICTDDDVTFPPNWLERLLSPFSRNDVMVVTGNVLPAELETRSQIEFENYGGLGRGFQRREFNRGWFDSFRRKAVPTWMIGATANAALRASLLRDSAVGLMDESLGAGTPAGVGEDTYLFYKTLKAGYTIIYEPTAYVWHKHRASDKALHNQIYNYSKGHTAYHITTFLNDHDCRGLIQISAVLSIYQLKQVVNWLCGSRRRSLRTILLEIQGNALGPVALWKSRRRVRKLGASSPYLAARPWGFRNRSNHDAGEIPPVRHR